MTSPETPALAEVPVDVEPPRRMLVHFGSPPGATYDPPESPDADPSRKAQP